MYRMVSLANSRPRPLVEDDEVMMMILMMMLVIITTDVVAAIVAVTVATAVTAARLLYLSFSCFKVGPGGARKNRGRLLGP